jgi:hypothetical protein
MGVPSREYAAAITARPAPHARQDAGATGDLCGVLAGADVADPPVPERPVVMQVHRGVLTGRGHRERISNERLNAVAGTTHADTPTAARNGDWGIRPGVAVRRMRSAA